MTEIRYFQSENVNLEVECHLPQHPSGKGIVFYSGGGWINDNRFRFHRFAGDLAAEGITVFLPQYRVYSIHKTLPRTAQTDAEAGLLFTETLFAQYGVDPQRVSWGGGSAGAQLILCEALVEPFFHHIGVLPDKMLLFNPVCCPHSQIPWARGECGQDFDFEGLCPVHDMGKPDHLPEILAMHGTEDEIAPAKDLEIFRGKYGMLGGVCRVRWYPGRGHGFHHPQSSEEDYQDTFRAALEFLR